MAYSEQHQVQMSQFVVAVAGIAVDVVVVEADRALGSDTAAAVALRAS